MQIAIFAKAPVAGQVKTRLEPLLGQARTVALHRQLIDATLDCARQAALGPLTLWIAGDPALPELVEAAARHGAALRAQRGADLGLRMAAAFDDTLAAHPDDGCLLIGTDCPALTPAHLREAAAALAANDLVLIPAIDGGYVLIGLNAPQPALFRGITWGSSLVLKATLARADALGLRCAQLAPLPDLDTPSDYHAALAAGWIRG